MSQPLRILAWADPAHTALLRGIARHPEITISDAGTPDPAQASRIAADLGAQNVTDLRATIDQARDIDLILLTSSAVLSREERAALTRFSGPAATLEPRPMRFADLRDVPADATLCARVPQWSHCLGDPALTEALRQFGPVHVAHVLCARPGFTGSLRSLFVDAAALLVRLMGEPESVDAARPGPPPGGETISLPSGSLTAHIRFAAGGAAALTCRAGVPHERCEALLSGSTGSLMLTGERWIWSAPDGAPLDEGLFRDARMLTADRIALELVAIGRAGRVTRPHVPEIMLLAAAEAARISTMTRSAESIAPMFELVGR